jgi:MarR family transcriptional regulator, transcriptional regulator for hemolysin
VVTWHDSRVPAPDRTPIGLELAGVAREVGRAFDAALAAAGGSRPTWLVLLALKARPTANQREIAAAVGIQGATLTHHLNGMEADGLLTRRRDPANRRVHVVELTESGEELFHRLRVVAREHDARLRSGFDVAEIDALRHLLERLRANVAG